MSQPFTSRGLAWFQALAGSLAPRPGDPASLRVADAELDGYPVRFLAVVPDPDNPFPRARQGESGCSRAGAWPPPSTRRWRPTARRRASARCWPSSTCRARPTAAARRPWYPPGAGRGGGCLRPRPARRASADRPAGGQGDVRCVPRPRLPGQPPDRLARSGVMVHAMGKAAAARITLRSVEELEALAAKVPPMAYDITATRRSACSGGPFRWRPSRCRVDGGPGAGPHLPGRGPGRYSSAARATSAAASARPTARRRRGCAGCCASSGEFRSEPWSSRTAHSGLQPATARS